MDIATAQAEFRASYLLGGPGALVSALVWLIAALVASSAGTAQGFATLFFGGMLISPVSVLIVRGLLRRSPTSPGNPGARTVIETVFPMIAGLFAAWLILPHRPEFVFPLCAIAVGAHYFGFRTAYGDLTYWVFAAALCLVGTAAIFARVPDAAAVPYVVAAIEAAFGVWLTRKALRATG